MSMSHIHHTHAPALAHSQALQPATSPLVTKQLVKTVRGVTLERAKEALRKHGGHYASALAELRAEIRERQETQRLLADHVARQKQAAVYGR